MHVNNLISVRPQTTGVQPRNTRTVSYQAQIMSNPQVSSPVSFTGLERLPIIGRFFGVTTEKLIRLAESPKATTEKLKNVLENAITVNKYYSIKRLLEKFKEYGTVLNPSKDPGKEVLVDTYMRKILEDKTMQGYLKTIFGKNQIDKPKDALELLTNRLLNKNNYDVPTLGKAMINCVEEFRVKLQKAGIIECEELVQTTDISKSAKVIIAPDLEGKQTGNHIFMRHNRSQFTSYSLVEEPFIELVGGNTQDGRGAFQVISLNDRVKYPKLLLDGKNRDPIELGRKLKANLKNGITPTGELAAPFRELIRQDEATLNISRIIDDHIERWETTDAVERASNFKDLHREFQLRDAEPKGFWDRLLKSFKDAVRQPEESPAPLTAEQLDRAKDVILSRKLPPGE